MNANLKIFITGFIIIVVAYFLIKNKNKEGKIVEQFKTKTLSGKECIPWKNAVQYINYGDSKSCKNPEKDVSGNWCYTDTFGNYEYCDEYADACMTVKVLDGCFNPDEEGYQIVIPSSQPFKEPYLDLIKAVDSTNQLWCLDKSGKFLRTTKKGEYLKYNWTDMIGDSLHNYNPESTRFYFISSFGVKKGGYVDTQKNNKDEEVTSLIASEVCYLFLRDYISRESNCFMRCILSEKINIQSLNPSYHITTGWRNRERDYINLGKKIVVDPKGHIFAIHREKIQNGKGLHWGDMVIGLEDNNGQIKFNLLGDTFPYEKVERISDMEYSGEETEDSASNLRRYIVTTKNKLFSNGIVKFIHKNSYIINELLKTQDSESIDSFMDKLAGKLDGGEEQESIEEFNRYLKYRIILNDDFKFIDYDTDKDFTYSLTKTDGNGDIVINPIFGDGEVLSLLNEFPHVEKINIINLILNKVNSLSYDLNLSGTFKKIKEIKKLNNDLKIIDEINNTGPGFNLNNLKFSDRINPEIQPIRSIQQEIDGIIEKTKVIKFKRENKDLIDGIKKMGADFKRELGGIKSGFKNSDINKSFNEVINFMKEAQDKLDLQKNNRESVNNFKEEILGIISNDQLNTGETESGIKKIYYKVVSKMMNYFVNRTEFIYDSLEKSISYLNDLVDNNRDEIKSRILESECYDKQVNFDINNVNLVPSPVPYKIRREITDREDEFGVRKWIYEYFSNDSNEYCYILWWRGNFAFTNIEKNRNREVRFHENGYNTKYFNNKRNIYLLVIPNNNALKRKIREYTENNKSYGNFRRFVKYEIIRRRQFIIVQRGDYNRIHSIIEGGLRKKRTIRADIQREYSNTEAYRNLNRKFKQDLEKEINKSFIKKKEEVATNVDNLIKELKNIIEPDPNQKNANATFKLNDSREKINNFSNYGEPWSTLPPYLLEDRVCTYDYIATDGSEEEEPRDEKNCFQDFVTRYMVNLRVLKTKIENIIRVARYPGYIINLRDRNFTNLSEARNNIEINNSPGQTVYPEVAKLLGEVEIVVQNLARKEAMLRRETNFFYMLDNLIEEEDLSQDFNSTQTDTLTNMFKLFLELSDNGNEFVDRTGPRKSRYDNYEIIDNDYIEEELYTMDILNKLYPENSITLKNNFMSFDTSRDSLTDEQRDVMDRCGDIYENRLLLDKLLSRERSLSEIMIDYDFKKNLINNLIPNDLTINFSNSLRNFKFNNNFIQLCDLSKDIQFNKLLTNFIGDDVQLFSGSEVNISKTYDNLFGALSDIEDRLQINNQYIIDEKTGLENNVRKTYSGEDGNSGLKGKFNNIINDSRIPSVIDYLEDNNNITIQREDTNINNKLAGIYDNLEITTQVQGLPDELRQSTFDTDKYTNLFTQYKIIHPKLKNFFSGILENLLRTFPNANILSYINYLNNYSRCSELDTLKKMDVLKETLKIMGEISNLTIHEGLNIGVIDFNVTQEYIYIDYLAPSAQMDNESLTKYDWNNKSNENCIKSLNLVTVRLNKDFIDHVFTNQYAVLKSIRYIENTDIVPNEIESEIQNSITIQSKTLTLYEKTEEGEEQKTLREEYNIGKETLKEYNEQFDEYKELENNNNSEYESIMRQLFFNKLNEEISRHTFIEQGRVFLKQNVNETNKLHVKLKEYDSSLSSRKIQLNYNDIVNESLKNKNINTTTNKLRYFHDYSDKEDHPNLLREGSFGGEDDKKIYNVIPDSITSATGIFGILNYNFSNSLYKGNEKEQKLLNNIYFKKNTLFQIYGKEKTSNNSGPIELINKTDLAYILTPYVKYTHGLLYTEDGKIKKSNYYGILYWFYLKQKEGKFINVEQWGEYYKTMVLEGLYNIAANPNKFKINTNFSIQFEEYVTSLESKPNIGRLDGDTLKTLLEFQKFEYDKDLKIESNYPQIKLHRLKNKRYGNQVFIEVVRFDPQGDEVDPKDLDILTLMNDFDKENNKDLRASNSTFLDKYSSNIQDRKNNLSFDYKYYRLIKSNKLKLLTDNNFCENSEALNKFNSLWKFKVINNFSDYRKLIEADREALDEATNRTKGVYDINNIYRDKFYYNFIKQKLENSKNVSIVKTAQKIMKDKQKNMLMGTGYPFMVIYQVRDYNGYPCQEGIKNSQKIFLTFNLKNSFIFDKLEDQPNDLINQKEGPIISEEFLAYTGLGSSIRFGFQKVRGDTPIKTKGVCDTSNPYEALPGYSDDCGSSGEGCGDIIVGKTRLDGTPKCALDDSEIKTKPVTPMEVTVTGNVSGDACDIYKVKGNKKIKYRLGKMFGYNDAGKYQLKNQYTIKYGDYYFYYKKKGNKILFKDEFNTDPEIVGNYAFNLTYGEDKYGVYILLSPHMGPKGENAKYLTRVINIYDKHFDDWKLEKRMDKVDDKKKDYVRDLETGEKKIFGQPDLDFYAQKFNLPEDLVLKIATEEGIKSELLDGMKSDLEKSNYLFCNLDGKGGNPLCKGDVSVKPDMTLDEENELLRKQSTQINSLMKRFDNIPSSYFTNNPQNGELLKHMKKTINSIETASEFVYKRIKDVNWVVKTQMKTNEEARIIEKNTEKISSNNVSDNSMNNLVDADSLMAEALKGMDKLELNTETTQPQCKSLEGFTNMDASPAPSPVNKYDRNMSGRYYNYVQKEIEVKKKNISELNDKIHTLLSGLNKMSDGMDLSGEKKQMLLSEMIQEKNKLEKMLFDIKNYEQQDRLNRIGEKLNEVESIRSEMEEDDFRTRRPEDDMNNVSIISREDGEFLNMYRIEDRQDSNHLVFLNGGCLEYEPEKKNISVGHCQADSPNQQFKIYRMEDRNDMENFNLKNSNEGIERAFDMVISNDGKCLHKENGELSFRNCNNIKNQYWDYSNITGPCNM